MCQEDHSSEPSPPGWVKDTVAEIDSPTNQTAEAAKTDQPQPQWAKEAEKEAQKPPAIITPHPDGSTTYGYTNQQGEIIGTITDPAPPKELENSNS